MMILGGPLANLVSGMIFIICGFAVTGIVYRIIAIYFGAAGIAVGIYNLFLGSVYSDGYTYREIKRDKDLGRIYNNIMLIYRELTLELCSLLLPTGRTNSYYNSSGSGYSVTVTDSHDPDAFIDNYFL